jgi:CheY-like chemotaxis protein
MDGSGRVELEAGIHDVAQTGPLSHGDLPPGCYVCIAVSDSGPGIDVVTLSRIFEPFFTTRPAGNGLGLTTVRDIVGGHGGMMNVQSAPRVGSRFEAWLPFVTKDASNLTETEPAAPFGHGETVLVVDEAREQLLRDEEILAALGYEPVGFTRVADALEACREAPKRFDILLVAHHVAVATTLELAADLHAIVPNVPIVLAAAWAKEATADALVAAGVSDVVHWPIVATETATALAGCSALRRFEATISGRPENGPASLKSNRQAKRALTQIWVQPPAVDHDAAARRTEQI